MYALQGWDKYHMAHPGLIAMFGATPGMTEAELIDFIVENRKRANTDEENCKRMEPSSSALPRP